MLCLRSDVRCQRCQCRNYQSMWRGGENIFFQEADVVKNKNLEDVIVDQLQAEARCIVQHPWFEETSEGWLRLHLFCYKISIQSASLVSVFFVLHSLVFRPYCKCQRGWVVQFWITWEWTYIYIHTYLYIHIYIYIFYYFFFYFRS